MVKDPNSSQLPRTRKGMESFIRKVVREELTLHLNEPESEVAQTWTPQQFKTEKLIKELNEFYEGVEL